MPEQSARSPNIKYVVQQTGERVGGWVDGLGGARLLVSRFVSFLVCLNKNSIYVVFIGPGCVSYKYVDRSGLFMFSIFTGVCKLLKYVGCEMERFRRHLSLHRTLINFYFCITFLYRFAIDHVIHRCLFVLFFAIFSFSTYRQLGCCATVEVFFFWRNHPPAFLGFGFGSGFWFHTA